MFKPSSFKEIYGQDHIVKTLENMDLGGQAILFEGERGSGKTSISHIIAKDFANDHNILHVNCGEEGKESIKDYIIDFDKSSIFGENKVYIFDEPQELHQKAMNTLLVPLEKLRKNVLVIFCSMNPEKIPKALADRFIRFRTRLLDPKTSLELLNYVLEKEGTKLDKFKKVLIAEKCDGNPRRIIKAIPKIKDIDNVKDIEYLLDVNAVEEDEDVLKLFKFLLGKAPWNKVRHLLDKLLKIKSPENIRIGILTLISNGLLKGFGVGKEKELIHIYDLLKGYEIPEKASLITAIAKIYWK